MTTKAPVKRYGVEFDLHKALAGLDEYWPEDRKTRLFTSVTNATTQALWYAAGRLDESPGQDQRLDWVKFSHFYAEDRFLFITDQIGMGMSMQSAWDAYVKEVTG